jgi:hypothetical protein
LLAVSCWRKVVGGKLAESWRKDMEKEPGEWTSIRKNVHYTHFTYLQFPTQGQTISNTKHSNINTRICVDFEIQIADGSGFRVFVFCTED